MIWAILVVPICLLIAVVFTAACWRSLNKPAPPVEPCVHPWYIDGRCIVCGTPR